MTWVAGATLSVTGHRPDKLGGYHHDAMGKLVSVAMTALAQLQPGEVVTGMALGWDTAVAIAAYGLGIPFVAAVPFEGQESTWPQNSQTVYREILQNAKRVVQVCEPGYAPWKMQRRNAWMVVNSLSVLAMWDGSDGGTANCVNYAQQQGRQIFNYYPMWKGRA